MDKRITVVLADANEEFRTALKQALEATGEFDVVGCAADGLAAASSACDSSSLSSPSLPARRIWSKSEVSSQGLGMKNDTPRLIACDTI